MVGQKKFDSLDPPPAALKEGGTEIFRAAVVHSGLHVSLRRSFDDPAMWGLLLVDIARHAARIYEKEGAMSFEAALKRIKDMYAAEMNSPTDLGETKPRHDA
jgi:hypothetical protein